VVPKALGSGAIQNTGGSLPHNNMMPTMGVNFIIAFEGIFPSQN
jgi:microcystin-dependent protein